MSARNLTFVKPDHFSDFILPHVQDVTDFINTTMRRKIKQVDFVTTIKKQLKQNPANIVRKIPSTNHAAHMFTQFNGWFPKPHPLMQDVKGGINKKTKKRCRQDWSKSIGEYVFKILSTIGLNIIGVGSSGSMSEYLANHKPLPRWEGTELVPIGPLNLEAVHKLQHAHDIPMQERMKLCIMKDSGTKHYINNKEKYDRLRSRFGDNHFIVVDDSFGCGFTFALYYHALKAAGFDMNKVHFIAVINEKQYKY